MRQFRGRVEFFTGYGQFLSFFSFEPSLVSHFVLWDMREAAGVAPSAAGNCFEKVETGFSGMAKVGLVWGIWVGIRARLWVFLHVLL